MLQVSSEKRDPAEHAESACGSACVCREHTGLNRLGMGEHQVPVDSRPAIRTVGSQIFVSRADSGARREKETWLEELRDH